MPNSTEKVTLQGDSVELDLTLEGGHVAPVRFRLNDSNWAMPYSLPPWQADEYPEAPALLRHLRGDFFCFPFGETEGNPHPHGETANLPWTLSQKTNNALDLTMTTSQPVGKVDKRIEIRDGQRALYQSHRISGVSGRFNYGHHPILEIPEGVVCPIRTSVFKFGSVYPGRFTNPIVGEYGSLTPDAYFTSLDKVPLLRGGTTSLDSFPAREGYEDLVMLSAHGGDLAWTAVTYPGYVWIALRSVKQLPSTLFWMSHGGRHQSPWHGRHRRRIGIEDVCSYFHEGAHSSRHDKLLEEGIETSKLFRPDQPTEIRHIQFVHPIAGQPGLHNIEYDESGKALRLHFEDGSQSTAKIDWSWLIEG